MNHKSSSVCERKPQRRGGKCLRSPETDGPSVLCYYHRQGIDRIFSSAAKFHSVVYLPFCHPNTPYTHAHLSLFCFLKAVCFAQATFLYRLQELWSDRNAGYEPMLVPRCTKRWELFKFMPMGIPYVVLRTSSSRLPLYRTVAALWWSRNDFCVCNTLSIYCFPIGSPQHRVQIFSTDARSHAVSLGLIDAFWSRLRSVIVGWGYDDLFHHWRFCLSICDL